MNHFPPNIQPVEVRRPKGARRIEAYSPKLGRRLNFYSRASFTLWLVIETDPNVRTFCERPGFVQMEGEHHLAQFFVQYAAHQEILLLMSADDVTSTERATAMKAVDSALPVGVVDIVELAASRIWTNNWARMLPLVTANRQLISRALLESISSFVSDARQLSTIERELSTGDPILVRAAVFTLLHSGRIRAPTLHTQTLSPITLFLPAREEQ